MRLLEHLAQVVRDCPGYTAAWLDRLADELRRIERSRWPKCTSIAASWCPVHGDCTCPPNCPECGSDRVGTVESRSVTCLDCGFRFTDDGSRPLGKNFVDCPLHAPDSTHAADPRWTE